jgi:hypothetical protein
MPKPKKNEKEKDFIGRCISTRHHEGNDNNKQNYAVCKSVYDNKDKKKKKKTKESFEQKLEELFRLSDEDENKCDICSTDTVSFAQFNKSQIKQKMKEKPLNQEHYDTYRRGFQFYVNEDLWGKTMKVDEKTFLCLECYERDYLTPYFEEHPQDKRLPNRYGFFHVKFNDLQFHDNDVNENADKFFEAVREYNKLIAQRQAKKKMNPVSDVDKRPMIGKHEIGED